MARLFFYLVVLLGGVYAAFKGALWYQLDQYARAQTAAWSQWGSLQFGGSFSTLSGRAGYSNVQWLPFGWAEPIRLRQVSVDFGSLPAMVNSTVSGWQQQPENLRVTFEDLTLSTASPLFDFLEQQLGLPLWLQQLASGPVRQCGVTPKGGWALLPSLGFSEVTLNIVSERQAIAASTDQAINVNVEFGNLARFFVAGTVPPRLARFSGWNSLEPNHWLRALADVNELRIGVEDRSYHSRLQQFCVRTYGVAEAGFWPAQTHLTEQRLASLGVRPSETVSSALLQFRQSQNTLELVVNPASNVNVDTLHLYSVKDMSQLLGLQLQLNGRLVPDFGFTMSESALETVLGRQLNPTVKAAPLPTPVITPSVRPTATERAYQNTPLAEAQAWVGRMARVRTEDGRLFEGTLVSTDDKRIEVRSFQAGGNVTYPIAQDTVINFQVWRPLSEAPDAEPSAQ